MSGPSVPGQVTEVPLTSPRLEGEGQASGGHMLNGQTLVPTDLQSAALPLPIDVTEEPASAMYGHHNPSLAQRELFPPFHPGSYSSASLPIQLPLTSPSKHQPGWELSSM